MRRSSRLPLPARVAMMAVASTLTLSSILAAGCGGSSGSASSGSSSQQSSSAQVASSGPSTTQGQPRPSAKQGPTLSLNLSIPVLLDHPLLGIPERYTCDGADISLPLRWSGIPHGTAELALFIASSKPASGAISFEWAVAGLKATSHGLAAGKLPPGAVVGRNSLGKVGYSICSPKGKRETYYAKLFALRHPLHPQSGFEANTLYNSAEEDAENVGLAAGAYRGR